jgi:hypothetical protein
MQRTVRRQKSRGQAIVEFALILPVFLLLTVGVVDMARLFTAYISLTNGVSNAALFAGQGGYGKWCSSEATDVPCPTDIPPGPGNIASNAAGNIAYQIQVEATGLSSTAITMLAPQCTLTLSPFTTGPCDIAPPKTYSQVKIVASYDVSLFTPLMNVLLGGGVHMTAATTSVTY